MPKRKASANETPREFQVRWTDRIRVSPTDAARSSLIRFDRWSRSRNWGSAAWGFFPLLLMLLIGGTVAWGKSINSATLLSRYFKAAEEAAPVKADGQGAEFEEGEDTELRASPSAADLTDEEERELTEYATLLFRRVLQLESENKRAEYYVAAQMAARGNLAEARAIMSRLAPDDEEGLPAAHAWVAADRLLAARAGGQQPTLSTLEHHLEMASRWQGTNPLLLLQYARMLESDPDDPNANKALGLYGLAADRDPRLRLVQAEALRRHGSERLMQRSAQMAIEYFSERIKRDEKVEDRLQIARAHLMLKEFPQAKSVLAQGLAAADSEETAKTYRTTLAELYRLEYLASASAAGQAVQMKLQLLEQGLEIDPSNAAIAAELARLSALLIQTEGGDSEEAESRGEANRESLRQQLAQGAAPAVSHAILGNLAAAQGNLDSAVTHWKLGLAINPGWTTLQRNLAVAAVRREPPDYEQAISLLDDALSRDSGDAATLDVKADVLRQSGELAAAAETYRKVLALRPLATVTHRKLAAVLELLGQSDDAQRHLSTAEQLEKRSNAIRKQSAQRSSEDAADDSATDAEFDTSPLPERVQRLSPGSTTGTLDDLLKNIGESDDSDATASDEDEASADESAESHDPVEPR